MHDIQCLIKNTDECKKTTTRTVKNMMVESKKTGEREELDSGNDKKL